VYRAAKERPLAIGIVDGYFERIPAVWHKEILWALSEGIHVFGAASMGALRAAELASFGMTGVGAIFEDFHSGALEDDDEVAVAHGDASSGYRATSEPMVNIRATFRGAEEAGVVTPSIRARLEAIAKEVWYPERVYPLLFARALEQGTPATEIDALRAFVTKHRVDPKRADAIALLEAIRECVARGTAPPPAKFSFAHTEAWDQVVDWAETQPPIASDRSAAPTELLAAEARLAGASGRAALATGLARAVAGVLGRRSGIRDRAHRVAAIDERLRRRHGSEEEPFAEWLRAQGLSRETYGAFLERNAEFDWLRQRYRDDLDRHVVDELRFTGDYPRLSRRAVHKQQVLASHGLAEPSPSDAGIGESELLTWYFARAFGISVPLDLEAFLPEIGVPSVGALRQEALREYLYAQLSTP
jgi:hypothetical protein